MASTPLPNPKPAIFSASHRLTPSEEDWLRQNLKETVDQARRILRERKQSVA
jgi:hypothetical protein